MDGVGNTHDESRDYPDRDNQGGGERDRTSIPPVEDKYHEGVDCDSLGDIQLVNEA